MRKRGRPVISGTASFQSELLSDAQTVSEAHFHKFGIWPTSDTLIASLLRQRVDWSYSRHKIASLVTLLSKAKAAERLLSPVAPPTLSASSYSPARHSLRNKQHSSKFIEDERAVLQSFIPSDAAFNFGNFYEALHDIIEKNGPVAVYAPPRSKTARMAGKFEQLSAAINADRNTAAFVMSRLPFALPSDLEKLASLQKRAKEIRLAAGPRSPHNALVDGTGQLRRRPANAPGDALGNDLIRAVAALVEAYDGEPSGPKFISLLRWCWKHSGRRIPSADAFKKRVSSALRDVGNKPSQPCTFFPS